MIQHVKYIDKACVRYIPGTVPRVGYTIPYIAIRIPYTGVDDRVYALKFTYKLQVTSNCIVYTLFAQAAGPILP